MSNYMNNHLNNIIIEAQGINKSFNGKPAVINFGLTLQAGEICGFLGPNGSGKTTTLRMLCGLLTPDSGTGHCLGYDLLQESYEIKRHVGYMTQSFSLYHDMTVRENLEFISYMYQIKNRPQQILHYLKMFNLTDHQYQLASNLSGGMKQRLALASCLLHQPKLLLLDEPTAGVDPKVRREFWDEIYRISEQGITTLVSTHYMDEAERCTKLIYIAYGHLLAEGAPEQIIQRTELHTWAVTGKNLTSLAQTIKSLPGVEQVAFFGEKLHISGKNEALLTQSLQPFQTTQNWEKIFPSLEDAFIHLVDAATGAPSQ